MFIFLELFVFHPTIAGTFQPLFDQFGLCMLGIFMHWPGFSWIGQCFQGELGCCWEVALLAPLLVILAITILLVLFQHSILTSFLPQHQNLAVIIQSKAQLQALNLPSLFMMGQFLLVITDFS